MYGFDASMEEALIDLVNNHLDKDKRLNIKKYQTSIVYVYDPTIIKQILKACKFKDVGNIYDYPKVFPKMRVVSGYDLTANFNSFQRIAVSNKLNSAVIYNFQEYSYSCTFVIDTKKLKKFAKITKPILQQDISQVNIFQDIDFKCKNAQYIEVSKAVGNSTKPVNAVKKTIADEKFIFEEKSILVEVINDITTFFTPEAKELHKKMDIPYKQGAILYGPPGTGKTAIIRELIRRIGSDVSKVIINPNIGYEVTHILSSLLRALNGKPVVIVIEDMDSLISDENRSEFLNILDGVDVKSGSYIIGTTNYPDRIDPAFVNRSGRFGRSYEINNPSYDARKLFFESKNLKEIFNSKDDISDIFAKHTEGFPMATLKEVITAAKYAIAGDPKMSIIEAVETATSKLKSDKIKHIDSHKKFKKKKKKNKLKNFDIMEDRDEEQTEESDNTEDQIITPVSSGYIKVVVKKDAEIKFPMLS